MEAILNYHKQKLLHAKTVDANETNFEAKTFIEHLLRGEHAMSEDDIIAHMLTMVLAGTDTLVIEYTMLLILLAQNPSVQQKAYEEIVQVLGEDSNICPSVEDLNRLEYLDRVLKECLRMFPAGPITARHVAEDITVTSENKEYVFPRGTTVAILVGNIQNNPLHFANPNSFDPDRWLPENPTKPPPFSYLPFVNGPRNCIGARYGMLQMKTMAATLLRNFEILTSKECEKFEDIHVEMNMTVKVPSYCKVRFRERRKNMFQHEKHVVEDPTVMHLK